MGAGGGEDARMRKVSLSCMVGARATTRPFPLLPTREHPVFIGKPSKAKNAVEGQCEKERCPWYRVGLGEWGPYACC